MPGFIITGELSSGASGSTWAAVRSPDDHRCVLNVLPVADAMEALTISAQLMAHLDRIGSEHVVRLHDAIALGDGTLALVLDEVTGGELADVLGARGQLTAGETVTTVAPLLGALADLHAAGVVHGGLTPASVRFSAEGRPTIGDLGVASLLGRLDGPFDPTSGFVAPELAGGAAASPAADVYALGALGWFCLTGSAPAPAATRPSLSTLRAETPLRLVEVLTSCLSPDPAARPAARTAAVEIFDAAPAESVALASWSDPAAEITRSVRAAAVSAPDLPSPSTGLGYRDLLVIAVVALMVAVVVVVLGVGANRFWRGRQVAVQRVAKPASTVPAKTVPPRSVPAKGLPAKGLPANKVPAKTALRPTDVVGASHSPARDAAGLMKALVDARALAYLTRTAALLDLVYAPGATLADADRVNIANALKNRGTYLGLSFVVKDVAFLDGTSDTVRIRATILTPAYQTGQPDGRKISHAREVVGPSVFTLSRTSDGWRILALATE